MNSPFMCGCGRAYTDAIRDGKKTLDTSRAEYRTCRGCRSTRAYIAADEISGRLVALYLNPNTSEIAAEYVTLQDAIEDAPTVAGAELRRNGALLGTSIATAWGYVWDLAEPEHEEPLDKRIRRV